MKYHHSLAIKTLLQEAACETQTGTCPFWLT